MVFRCPRGTKKQFRFKGRVRLGGCARGGKFIIVKEAKIPKKRK